MAFQDGNIIIGTSVDMKGMNTGLKKIKKGFNGIASRVGTIFGITSLGLTGAFVALGRAALDAASDLQEVQNVVDVSFTKMDEQGNVISDMTYKVEGFANTCVERFGMSRLAAKQTAGSFMAMGKSMGLTMEEASDMSVKLTGLTGDFASFYNISQDYARVALSAVYTGETETLKRYGIVLTEANLQQYAMSQGLDVNVKKLDARSKAILRYMYIMQATKDMEGDFVRTQESWANQTRLLKQVWQEFLITLGNGLITVLTPLIKALNVIVQKLTDFTAKLWKILAGIFGWQLQDLTQQATGAITPALEDMTEATEELGDEVTSTGKKIHKQLANFDDLNNIMTTKKTDTSGTTSLTLPPIDLGDFGIEEAVEEAEEDLPQTLRELGAWIGRKLCEMMENIDWQAIYEKARNFGKGLADFLNGLFVDTDLFKDVGHTIAGALNTVVYAALEFFKTIEWDSLGKRLSEGLNEFIATVDWASVAELLNEIVDAMWELLVNFVKNIDYKQIFEAIKEFITNLDADTLFVIIGFIFFRSALWKLIKKTFLEALIGGITEALGSSALASLGSTIGSAIGALILNAIWLIPLAGAIALFIDQLKNGMDAVKTAIMGALEIIAVVAATVILGPFAGIVVAVIAIVMDIVLLVHEYWDEIVAWWTGTALPFLQSIGEWILLKCVQLGQAVWAFIKIVFINILAIFETAFLTIKGAIVGFIDMVKNILSDIWTFIKDIVTAIAQTVISVVQAILTGSTEPLNKLKEVWIKVFSDIWQVIKDILNGIIGIFEGMCNGIIQGIENFINRIIDAVNTAKQNIASVPGFSGSVSLKPHVQLARLNIPRLAQGAVIPPNNEFMAMLGDQKSGTNIEAPLETIKQALAEVMTQFSGGGDNSDIVIQIDGREIARAVRNQNTNYRKATGRGLLD